MFAAQGWGLFPFFGASRRKKAIAPTTMTTGPTPSRMGRQLDPVCSAEGAGRINPPMEEEFGAVQTFFDFANDLLLRFRARLQEMVAWSDSRSARQASRRVGCCLQAQLSRRVRIQDI